MRNNGLAEIIDTLPSESRLRAAGRLVRLGRSLSRQRKADLEFSDSLLRVLSSPHPQSATLRLLIKEIVSERE